MQSISESVVVATVVAPRRERLVSDLIYQGMTIAAMLWLLASLWAF